MTSHVEAALSDTGVADFLTLSQALAWTEPQAATVEQLLNHGWQTTRRGIRLIHPEGMSGQVIGDHDTLAVSLTHTTWVPGTDVTATPAVQRIAHVISLVSEQLSARPQAIRLDTGEFAARWVLDAGTSVVVDARTLKRCSPTLTAAETFRIEKPHKYAEYLGGS